MNQRPSLRPARHGNSCLQWWFALCVLVSTLTASSSAQVGRPVPRESYYFAKVAFYEGEYGTALRGFNQAARSGIRVGNVRWIDSICYYSMLGECYYHLGQLPLALEHHEQALRWFVGPNRHWLSRIQFPLTITPANDLVRAKITWGQRATRLGYFPDTMNSAEGTLDLTATFELGGVVNPAHYRRVDAVEVARCMAQSLRRRAELLGPVSRYSKLSARLSTALSGDLVPSRHWATAWTEVLYGLALIGDGQDKEGRAHLASGAVVGGFDHPLTGIALLELGKLTMRDENYAEASQLFLQASLAAAQFEQAGVVEEAFRYLTDAYLAADTPAGYSAVDRVVLWAQSEDFDRLHAALLMNAAEIAVYANDLQATGLLEQASRVMARRDLAESDLGGRFLYLRALTQYRLGNSPAAGQAMRGALAYMQRGSFRRFHLAKIEQLHAGGRKVLSPRRAEQLFEEVLREPRDLDWRTQPLETISMLLSPHTRAIEKWFELLIDRKAYDDAVSVAEQLRRHRFYSTLPVGGRLLSLRWLIEGSEAMLGKRGLEQRSRLRRKYPQLGKLSRESQKLQAKLRLLPTLPDDKTQIMIQRDLFSKLAQLGQAQENIVRELALRREPARLVFPPQPSLKPIQRAMRDNQAMLMFVTTQQGWHAWFIRKSDAAYSSIKSPAKVRRSLTTLLRSIGNRDRNAAVQIKDVTNTDWKTSARQIWHDLIGEFPSNGWDDLEELIIVPDGPLWYLPFEVLQVPAEQIPGAQEDQTLLDMVRIRYSPTASLAVGDRTGHKPELTTTFVAGQLFPRESSEPAKEMLARLKASLPNVEVLGRAPVASSSLMAGLWDRLIVWDDIDDIQNGPYQWSPAQFDRGQSNSLLADWIEFPWGAPDQIILPGFHTAAESSLGKRANGNEIFLTVCGLMATGTRTILLSRWRVGGVTPTILVREFAAELPRESAALAWQRAVDLVRVEQLEPTLEPRLKGSSRDGLVSADHPFFWSGYLLIDTGTEPRVEKVAPPKVDPPAEADGEPNDEADAEENNAE